VFYVNQIKYQQKEHSGEERFYVRSNVGHDANEHNGDANVFEFIHDQRLSLYDESFNGTEGQNLGGHYGSLGQKHASRDGSKIARG